MVYRALHSLTLKFVAQSFALLTACKRTGAHGVNAVLHAAVVVAHGREPYSERHGMVAWRVVRLSKKKYVLHRTAQSTARSAPGLRGSLALHRAVVAQSCALVPFCEARSLEEQLAQHLVHCDLAIHSLAHSIVP